MNVMSLDVSNNDVPVASWLYCKCTNRQWCLAWFRRLNQVDTRSWHIRAGRKYASRKRRLSVCLFSKWREMIVWRIACRRMLQDCAWKIFCTYLPSPHINTNCCRFNISHSANFRDDHNNNAVRPKITFYSSRLAMLNLIDAKVKLALRFFWILSSIPPRCSLLKSKN